MSGFKKRGSWSETGNQVFTRCPKCNTIRVYGICQNSDCGTIEENIERAKFMFEVQND